MPAFPGYLDRYRSLSSLGQVSVGDKKRTLKYASYVYVRKELKYFVCSCPTKN